MPVDEIPGQQSAGPELELRQSRLVSGLEAMGKFVALFVGLAYATGFLIISIHHAQYGISQFDPLRPKIFSTGMVFFVLTGVSVLTALRVFHVFDLRKTAVFTIQIDPENKDYATAFAVLSFWPACRALTVFCGFIFVNFDVLKPWGFTANLVAMLLYVVVAAVEAKRFNKHPDFFLVIDFVIVIGMPVAQYHFGDHRDFFVTLWFYGTGLGGVFMSKLVRDPKRLKAFEWERQFPAFAAVLLLYSTVVYENVRPSLGGGSPTPATLYLAGKSPVPDLDTADVLILEETDHGYYILRPGVGQSAYFLRRDLVSAIHFPKRVK